MGAGRSKHPDWYPGEPAADALATCSSCQTAADKHRAEGMAQRPRVSGSESTLPPSDRSEVSGLKQEHAPSGSNDKFKREPSSLPVVELVDFEFIASGAFCDVYSCKYRGWEVVAKRVRADLPAADKRAALANLWNEHECLRVLRHPNIIDVYGICRIKGYENDEFSVCILLEQLALGTVGHLFDTNRHLEKNLVNTISRSRKMKMVPFHARLDRVLELALALEYVHGRSGVGTMMHRDIKNVNIGFAQNGNLKLMDFGLAKVVGPIGCPENDTYQMTGEVGSYRYMAPELVKHEPYNAKADVYSWAVISWEILAVNRPYAFMNETKFVARVILKGERPPLQKEWPECLRVLLASAWSPDLTARPTAEEVVVALRAIKADLPAARRRQSLPLKRRSSSQQTRASSASTFLSCDRDRDGDDHGEMLGISPVYAPAKSRFSFSLDGPPSQRKYKRSPALAKCSSQDTGRTRRCSFKSISSKGKGSGNGGTGPGRTDGTGGKNRLSRAASMRQDHLVQPKDTAPLSTGATLGAADGDGGTHGSRGSGSSNRSSAPCACTNCSLLQDKSALGNVRDAIVAALARCAAAQNPSQPLAAAAVGGGCDDTDSISSVTEAAGVSVASDEKQCMNTDCGLEDSRCPRREDPRSAPSSGEQVNDLRGSSRTSSLKKLWPKASPVASPPLSSISAPNPTILTCNSSSNVSTADGDTSVSSDQGKVAANVQEGGKLLDRWPHEDSGDSVSVKALVLAFEESQLLSSSKVNSLRKMAANRGPSPTMTE